MGILGTMECIEINFGNFFTYLIRVERMVVLKEASAVALAALLIR